ncbi:MAG: endonuclease domain-containing protein [Anaerolineales bacterium]|nr:endonuclease domain-containing protein [Anaerolineales bacterium]
MSTLHPPQEKWDRVRKRAKELRKTPTPAEQILWQALRNRRLCGLKIRRQVPLGPFIADFYCAQHRLVVELDGGVHCRRIEADAQRTMQLERYGYQVLRVQNEEVETDLAGVLEKISVLCGAEALLPGSGEGRADGCPPG